VIWYIVQYAGQIQWLARLLLGMICYGLAQWIYFAGESSLSGSIVARKGDGN